MKFVSGLFLTLALMASGSVFAELEVNAFNLHGCWTNGDFEIHFNSENMLGGTIFGSSITPFGWLVRDELVFYRMIQGEDKIDTILQIEGLTLNSFSIQSSRIRINGGEFNSMGVVNGMRSLYRCPSQGDSGEEVDEPESFSGV